MREGEGKKGQQLAGPTGRSKLGHVGPKVEREGERVFFLFLFVSKSFSNLFSKPNSNVNQIKFEYVSKYTFSTQIKWAISVGFQNKFDNFLNSFIFKFYFLFFSKPF